MGLAMRVAHLMRFLSKQGRYAGQWRATDAPFRHNSISNGMSTEGIQSPVVRIRIIRERNYFTVKLN